MIDLSGIMTAIVTPLNADRTLNREQLKNLIDFQIKNGVHSILALGGTGEYPALTMEVRKETVDCTVEYVNKRVLARASRSRSIVKRPARMQFWS